MRNGSVSSGLAPVTHYALRVTSSFLKSLSFILCEDKDRSQSRDLDQPLDAGLEVREVDLAAGLADLLERFDEDGDGAAVHVGDFRQVEDDALGRVLLE